MAAKLREARAMRETYRNQLTETHDVAVTLEDQPGMRSLFARRFTRLKEIVEGFKEHHAQIIKTVGTDEELADEELIRKEFDSKLFAVEDIYYSLCPEKTISPASPTHSCGSSTPQNIRLPKIPLRTFSGNFADWCSFHQSFNSAIHNNVQLADIDKFQYLLSCLSGEPLNMVKSLQLSEDNYPIAYQALRDRYDNKRELASYYWNELKSTTKLTGESAKSLRRLLDRFKENRSALQALKLADNLEDFLWFSMLLDRLDTETRRLFESEHRSEKDTVPSFATLASFVESQCRVLDSVGVVRDPQSKPSKPSAQYAYGPNFRPKVHAKTLFVNATANSKPASNPRCRLCSQTHQLQKCQTFLSKPASERFVIVKSAGLCFNCLGQSHSVGTCPSAFSCKECRERHHSLLHFKKTRQAPSEEDTAPSQEPQVDAQLVTSCTGEVPSNSNRNVLLATAAISLVDKWGNTHTTRALLDTGSQASFIVASRANQLGLPRTQNSVAVFGLGHTPSKPSLGTARCEILSRHGRGQPAIIVDLVVLPQICGPLPNSPIDPTKADHMRDLDLADPEWYKPAPIDILLGSDALQSILLDGVVSGNSERPMALRTVFGWVMIGPVAVTESPVQALLTCIEPTIDRTLQDFWKLEEVPSKPVVSPEDQQAESIFVNSVYREPSGRFGVALPFKTAILPVFENSRSVADRRWLALERRLRGQPDLKRLYGEFMTDYLASGHMSPLIKEPSDSECYFIPHHCVVKSDRGEAKIRVVFDASARALNQVALNEELLVGSKLQNDIFQILLNFRSKPVVFTADIRQMYRQINIIPEHRRYQLIRYRFSDSEPVQTFQLNTVTYGVSSAPYLAIRTLLHLAEISEAQYPLAAQAIRKSIYVDDLVCAVDSEESAQELKTQLINLFASGCFELRKWTSNRPALLADLPKSHCQVHPSTFEGNEDFSTKILGLQWHAGSDTFSFQVQPKNSPCTKRSMLSEVARIFDPLGFLAPLSFLVKHLIQRLWTLGLDWDDAPPEEICRQWRLLKHDLGELVKVKIPRPLFEASPKECQLHAFCDASQRGYACAIYLRYLVEDVPKVVLLTAKSKVAPLKCLSIPRLELCAAVLLAKLVAFVVDALKDNLAFGRVVAWTDSTVALTWIRSSPHRWKTFIANRVVYIQERVPPDCWRHVRSHDNPADPASRGLLPDEIRSCSLWWAGPEFLRLPPSQWPTSPVCDLVPAPDVPLEEAKVVLVTELPQDFFADLILRFSSLRKIQKIVARVLRFIKMTRTKTRLSGALTEYELHNALLAIVKAVQAHVFTADIAKIRNDELGSKPFRKLSPFLDEAGVLRVGGRLKHSKLPFERKHPALLPGRHQLTEMIILDLHRRHSHPGINTTMYLVQQKFWVLSARRAVRHYLALCYPCFRTKPSSVTPPMGDLPSLRVSQLKPFSCVGVDYGGPFTITMARTRGAKTLKAYLCLFVCFATKAIHVEVASDLSTDTFLAALRRFIARRGRCSQIHSDNGTNFVGANRELTRMMKSAAEAEAIEWHFNPPSAPHFGGLWETGIKSVKTHMSRVVGSQTLTFEELSTLVVQVEGLLNSRPLCSVSTDPNDFDSLTPGHFLTLEPLSAPPDPDLSHLQVNRLSRWQLVQRMHQQFWVRWRDEYLHTLYQRGKWCKGRKMEQTDVGTLVLIKDELAPPLKWRTGRIEELHPGADGICRVASVRTPQGLVKRPMVKLCPLPNQ